MLVSSVAVQSWTAAAIHGVDTVLTLLPISLYYTNLTHKGY